MKSKTAICFVLGIAWNIFQAFPQSADEQVIEQIIESIAEDLPEEIDYSELNERLNYYRRNPLNINFSTREELAELVFLSSVQIENLILHREQNGLFLNMLELQTVSGFDPGTVQLMLLFTALGNPPRFEGLTPRALLDRGSHEITLRVGGNIGDLSDSEKYQGSWVKLLSRYRFNIPQLMMFSLNMEKDAGETFFTGPNKKGFDFYSGSLYFSVNKKLKKVVLGDYTLQFGQGLSMWSGLSFGKGSGFTGIGKQSAGLRPYSSVNEANFFRGGSVELHYGKLSITPFFSYKKVDASLSNEGTAIRSLIVSGLHRTETEIYNRNSASQMVFGANLQVKVRKLTIGLTGHRTSFDKAFEQPALAYQRFGFSGKSLLNGSLSYTYVLKNSYLFGETAHSYKAGSATVNGLLISLTPSVSFSFLYRNYGRSYSSFYSQALSESTKDQNEKGFYSALAFRVSSKWELLTYSDLFTFDWLKFRVNSPSFGFENSVQLTYAAGKKIKILARYKQEQKFENEVSESVVPGLEKIDKKNYRLELNLKVSENFSLRNRLELVEYRKGGLQAETGLVSYQDLLYKPLNSRFAGNLRFSIFDTKGFNSRIYTFENDVLNSYSVPAFQGNGLRFYINGRYALRKQLDLWVRYSKTSYSPRIEALNHQGPEFKIQIRYRFDGI